MTKLRDDFTAGQWKDCCGKGCKKCEITRAYADRYGRDEGLDRLRADRATVKKRGKKRKRRAKADRPSRA